MDKVNGEIKKLQDLIETMNNNSSSNNNTNNGNIMRVIFLFIIKPLLFLHTILTVLRNHRMGLQLEVCEYICCGKITVYSQH